MLGHAILFVFVAAPLINGARPLDGRPELREHRLQLARAGVADRRGESAQQPPRLPALAEVQPAALGARSLLDRHPAAGGPASRRDRRARRYSAARNAMGSLRWSISTVSSSGAASSLRRGRAALAPVQRAPRRAGAVSVAASTGRHTPPPASWIAASSRGWAPATWPPTSMPCGTSFRRAPATRTIGWIAGWISTPPSAPSSRRTPTRTWPTSPVASGSA